MRSGFVFDDSGDDSDLQSLVSSADSSESAHESSDPDASLGEDEEPDGSEKSDDEKHISKEYQVWSNPYFAAENHPKYTNVKITARPRWCQAEYLGITGFSKSVTPDHYGETKESPQRSYAVLRSWCIWRCREGLFVEGNSGRM